ncbi:hypothetical protein A3Q56_02402 [Intoshia linei]|uniref:Creatine kinase n=1 Tax=Intoshia linei TaxID=1819745 RepID=A0A177B8A7_9BILA|nr:hypothetical protein A3Q56_02402 [Intoshia linei]
MANITSGLNLPHLSCEIVGRPCCYGIQGECVITAREECDFRQGYFHTEATLCSQVHCMNDICGMFNFINPEIPDQFYRLITSNFIHSGLLHIAITVIIQMILMRDIEKMIGWWRTAIIYILSGLAGTLMSAIFLPHYVDAGPSGAHFVEIIRWSSDDNRMRTVLVLLAIFVFLLAIGLLPVVDNYAHCGGFVIGFLLALALRPLPRDENNKRIYKVSYIISGLVGLILCLCINGALVYIFYYYPLYSCDYCSYFNCIPLTSTFCDGMYVDIKSFEIKSKKHGTSRPIAKLSMDDFAKGNYPNFKHHNNYLAEVLTEELYIKYLSKVTPLGGTLDKCIQCGVDSPSNPYIKKMLGILATDEHAYAIYSEIFDKIIEMKHGGFGPNHVHPKPNLDNSLVTNGELDSEYVISCRIRTGRNIRGFSLPPSMSRAERKRVEKHIVEALSTLSDNQAGKFLSLETMTDADRDKLIEDHILFDKPTGALLKTGGMARDWPQGRGIWCNKLNNFFVWVNEEDHIRIISMEKGGDMKSTFDRFCDALKKVEKVLNDNSHEFQHSERLGFICSCPTNIGTGLRCSVLIKLANLNNPKNKDLSDELFKLLRLQKRGSGGENSEGDVDVSDLSNSERIGVDEVTFVQNVIDSVHLVIKIEKCLENEEDYTDHMNAVKELSEKIKPKFTEMTTKPLKNVTTVTTDQYTSVYRLGEALNTMNLPISDNYPDLTKHANYLPEVLSKNLYKKYGPLRTSNGCTIDMCIQCGVDTPGHPHIKKMIGVVACDEECYTLFGDLFDKIVEMKHKMPKDVNQPPADLETVLDYKLDEEYVVSCRVRTGRSIKGIPLPPSMNRYERRKVETIVSEAVKTLDGEFEGKYYPLMDMNEEDQNQLIKDHFLFGKPEGALLVSSRMARDWPDARGIWHNKNKNFLIWINEEDHMRIISMELGGDMGAVFNRFCTGLKQVEELFIKKGHNFMHSEHLGYICTCPTNLGTVLRCSVHIRLIELGTKEENSELFDTVLTKLRLQKRGSDGENDAGEFGVFDVSNFERMNRNEPQLVSHVCKSVNLLIDLEKTLKAGESYDEIMTNIDDLAANY